MSKQHKIETPNKFIPFPEYAYSKDNNTIWGNVVDIDGFGILILGRSQAGKSDLSLRITEDKTELFDVNHNKVRLVCDDRVLFDINGEGIFATVPEEIAGLIEIHGYGIFKVDYIKTTEIKMVIELIKSDIIERLPYDKFIKLENITIPYFMLDPFSQSALIKLKYAIMKVKKSVNCN